MQAIFTLFLILAFFVVRGIYRIFKGDPIENENRLRGYDDHMFWALTNHKSQEEVEAMYKERFGKDFVRKYTPGDKWDHERCVEDIMNAEGKTSRLSMFEMARRAQEDSNKYKQGKY